MKKTIIALLLSVLIVSPLLAESGLRPNMDDAHMWKNHLVSINNLAIHLATKEREVRQYDLAVLLLDQGVALDPSFETFYVNYAFVFFHWIRDLVLDNRFDDARNVFAIAQKRIPDNAHLSQLMKNVDQAEQRAMQRR